MKQVFAGSALEAVQGGGNGESALRWICRSVTRHDSRRYAGSLRIAAASGGAGCGGDASLVSAGIIPRSNRTCDRRSEWTCHRTTPQWRWWPRRGWQHRGCRACGDGRRGDAGMPAVALDSKGNLWAFQRAPAGKPQLFKFDPNYKLILQVGQDVIGYQDKAHGMAVDAEDSVWITAANGATVMKISPEGKLLLTIGERGRRGDWNEAKQQRLLWQPVMIAFDPTNGDVWIGDREEYRIVVYSGDGRFLKTMQMRNLVCALYFDSRGQPWMASGQDGQFLKLNRNGKVLGAIGNGMGIGSGQFIEASYWVMDKQDNLYAGDTSVGRVTKMVAPKKRTDEREGDAGSTSAVAAHSHFPGPS